MVWEGRSREAPPYPDFTLTAIAHAGGALYFGYLAAGYETAGITRWVGWQ